MGNDVYVRFFEPALEKHRRKATGSRIRKILAMSAHEPVLPPPRRCYFVLFILSFVVREKRLEKPIDRTIFNRPKRLLELPMKRLFA
jgi:hypothetical protein